MTDDQPKPEPLSTDELIAQMERDEVEGATKLSPREYGLTHGIKPQLVYYYIRKGELKLEQCICGRNVVDVEAADTLFSTKKGQQGGQADEEV